MTRIWFFIALGFTSFAHSQTQISVLENAWVDLSLEERTAIQRDHLVSPLQSSLVGVVIDNQGIDNSTPGSNGGSALGGAVASATYIDNAFRPDHNYSAKGHLAAIILGNVLGSALNRAPNSEYHFRYAIKNASGDISYHDSISQSPFRHPVGVCVLLPQVALPPNQDLCFQTADSLRTKYLKQRVRAAPMQIQQALPEPKFAENSPATISPQLVDKRVLCKVAELPPVQTSENKCELINGEIIR